MPTTVSLLAALVAPKRAVEAPAKLLQAVRSLLPRRAAVAVAHWVAALLRRFLAGRLVPELRWLLRICQELSGAIVRRMADYLVASLTTRLQPFMGECVAAYLANTIGSRLAAPLNAFLRPRPTATSATELAPVADAASDSAAAAAAATAAEDACQLERLQAQAAALELELAAKDTQLAAMDAELRKAQSLAKTNAKAAARARLALDAIATADEIMYRRLLKKSSMVSSKLQRDLARAQQAGEERMEQALAAAHEAHAAELAAVRSQVAGELAWRVEAAEAVAVAANNRAAETEAALARVLSDNHTKLYAVSSLTSSGSGSSYPITWTLSAMPTSDGQSQAPVLSVFH